MPDSPLSDPRISNKTPKAWAQQLQGRVQGHALWHASPAAEGGGSVGDCGYIDGGRFIKLFNIFDAHNVVGIDPTLYRLTFTDIRSESKENVFPLSYSSRIRTIDLGMNLQTGPLQLPPLINATLSTTVLSERERMAFLAFCGPTTTSSRFDKTRLLENYLIAEHGRILSHYRTEHPVEMNNLLIIQGAKTAASWLGGLASGHQLDLRGEVSVSGIGASVEMLSLEENGWSVTHGKRDWGGPHVVDSEPCIVVKPIKMRAKARMLSRFSSVVGIQGSKSHMPARAQPEDRALMGSTGPSGDVLTSEPTVPQEGFVFSFQSTGDGRSRSKSDNPLIEVESDQSDEPLLDDQTDLLDEVLDFVLDSWPTARYAVGNWGLIETFIELYGEFPENWQKRNILTAVVEACGETPSEPHDTIVRVINIQLRSMQPVVYLTRHVTSVAESLSPLSVYAAGVQLALSTPMNAELAFCESAVVYPPTFDRHSQPRTRSRTSSMDVETLVDESEASPFLDELQASIFLPGEAESGFQDAYHAPSTVTASRRHVSLACEPCRRRRCKCDGKGPTCGSCRSLEIKCSWTAPVRGKHAAADLRAEKAKLSIRALEAEIRQLREFCRGKGIDVDNEVPSLTSAAPASPLVTASTSSGGSSPVLPSPPSWPTFAGFEPAMTLKEPEDMPRGDKSPRSKLSVEARSEESSMS